MNEIRHFSFYEIFSYSAEIYKKRFKDVFFIVFFVYFPLYIIHYLLMINTPFLNQEIKIQGMNFYYIRDITYMLIDIAGLLASLAIIHLTYKELFRVKVGWADSIKITLSKWHLVIITSIIYYAATFLGLILFIVPGVIIATMFVFYVQAMTIHDSGIVNSLSDSKNIVSGKFWKTLFFFLLISIVSFIFSLIIYIAEWLTTYDSVITLAAYLIFQVLSGYFVIAATIYYLNLYDNSQNSESQYIQKN